MCHEGHPEKLRKVTDAYLESRGVSVKVKPISILDEDFQEEVEGRTRLKTKAAEIDTPCSCPRACGHSVIQNFSRRHVSNHHWTTRTGAPAWEKVICTLLARHGDPFSKCAGCRFGKGASDRQHSAISTRMNCGRPGGGVAFQLGR